jgi:glutamyl-tRNA reductase
MSGAVPPDASVSSPGTEPSVEKPTAPARPPLPSLIGLELSLETAPLVDLEAATIHLVPDRLASFFATAPGVSELVLLRTCHRAEVYLWVDRPTVDPLFAEELLPPGMGWKRRDGIPAVRHLFRVAAGLESMAVGEGEVRRQVGAAAGRVLTRAPRPVLRPLLHAAVAAAEATAPQVPVERSIAAIAARRILAEERGRASSVVVVGSGSVGRQVAQLLVPAHPVTLLYYRRPPSSEFTRRVPVRVQPLSTLREELQAADVLLSAAKSGDRLIGPRHFDGRERPVLAVDLGVPRNIDPAVGRLPGVRLLDLESLRTGPPPAEETDLAGQIDQRATEAAAIVRTAALEAWVDRVRRHVELRRRETVERARRFLGPLGPDQAAAMDELTRRVVAEVLAGPTEGLRSIPDGPEGEAIWRWVLQWLDPTPDDP